MYKVHPVADLFPMLAEAELRELANDIKKNGLYNDITVDGDILLDGRNRLAACKLADVAPRFREYDGDSPVTFIISQNLRRRHLDTSQRAALAVEIEPHFAKEAKKRMLAGVRPDPKADLPQGAEGQSRAAAAAVVGVSGRIVSDAKAIKAEAPEVFERVISGEITVNKAKREVDKAKCIQKLDDARKSISDDMKTEMATVCDLRVCSCADLFAAGIKPDAVITDPPYPEEFLPVFSELAQACASAGVPIVAVMSGQTYLPEVMKRLCDSLQYRWMLAYMTPGGQAVQQWQAKVNTSWKPVLLFGTASKWFGDVAVSKTNDNDKRFHGWGQSESGMADIVERLTEPGSLVCDPFLGGGTTAVVCMRLSRRFVGCDIEAANVDATRMRIEAEICQK